MKVAIITVLFDYPNHFIPTFENKLLTDFDKNDYYIVRYFSESDEVKNESYYFKFTHFRIKKLVSFIETTILNKYDFFILLDATDVGYVGNINSIPRIMEDYKCDILFGGERNNWPITEYSHLYSNKKVTTPYKFLNAGVFCAKPKEFINHINTIISRGFFGLCDQGNWQIEYLLTDGIEIDYNNKLVLNTYLAKDDIVIDNNIVSFKTTKPLFVHDNGGFNDDTVKLLDFFQ
jgi:hypothetical protein